MAEGMTGMACRRIKTDIGGQSCCPETVKHGTGIRCSPETVKQGTGIRWQANGRSKIAAHGCAEHRRYHNTKHIILKILDKDKSSRG